MELKTEPILWLNGSPTSLPKKVATLQVVKQLPDLNPRAIERAIESFIKEVDIKGDWVGFFNQTLESIASATFLNRGGDFWLAEEDGEVMAYALGSICKDIDNKLTYSVPQAWLHPNYRRSALVKEWWESMRKRAQDCLAQHILIVSARNPKAFCRWLGHGAHLYATLLKEDL